MDSLSSKSQLSTSSTSQIKKPPHPNTDSLTISEDVTTSQPLDKPTSSSIQPKLDLNSNPVTKKLDQVSTEMLVESSEEIQPLVPTVKGKLMSEKAQLIHTQVGSQTLKVAPMGDILGKGAFVDMIPNRFMGKVQALDKTLFKSRIYNQTRNLARDMVRQAGDDSLRNMVRTSTDNELREALAMAMGQMKGKHAGKSYAQLPLNKQRFIDALLKGMKEEVFSPEELKVRQALGNDQYSKATQELQTAQQSFLSELREVTQNRKDRGVVTKKNMDQIRNGDRSLPSSFDHLEDKAKERMTTLFEQVNKARTDLNKTTYGPRVVDSAYATEDDQELFLFEQNLYDVAKLPYGEMVKHFEKALSGQDGYKMAWSLAMKSPEELKKLVATYSFLSTMGTDGQKLTDLTHALFNTAMQQLQSQGGVKVNDDGVPPDTLTVKGVVYQKGAKLGEGTFGIAFMYTANTGEKLVLKAFKSDRIDVMQEEVRAHHEAMGPDDQGNPHLLGLKGMIYKEGVNHKPGLIMTLTEPASGGEMRDIHDRLNALVKGGVLTQETAQLIGRRMMAQALEGMLYLQRDRQMIHYDLKPENIFLTEDGTVKIADLGMATVGEKGQGLKGSPVYMSPESLNDRNIEFHTDTWSLGVIAREMFSGELKLPMNAQYLPSIESLQDRMDDFRQDDRHRVVKLGNDMDGKENVSLRSLGSYEEVINAMMHPDPKQRPNLEVVSQHPFFSDPSLEGEKLQALMKMVLTLPKAKDGWNMTDEEIGFSPHIENKLKARQDRDRFNEALEQLKPLLKQMEQEVHQETIRI